MFFDKAIAVLDRPIHNAGHFQLNPLDIRKTDLEFLRRLPVTQAGYRYDKISLTANLDGRLTGLLYMPFSQSTFLLTHHLKVLPGDSGSALWNDDGIIGIVQSQNFATPITPSFVSAYNRIAQEANSKNLLMKSNSVKIPVYRIEM